jgi:uncharacterized protein (TIGR00661 family)
MTQAMAVAGWLRARGHEVVAALVGESERRSVPEFVRAGLAVPILQVPSPNFVADEHGAVHLWHSVWHHGRRWISRYEPAVGLIDEHVREIRPDVLVNFFEAMTGYWALRRRPAVPIVAVAHQFMLQHPVYRAAPGAPLQEASLRTYTFLLGARAHTRLALSLYPAPSVPDKRLRVMPPILRPEAHALAANHPTAGRALLAYLMEPGLADGLRSWSERNPRERLHCYWDGPAGSHGAGLRFHPLDGVGFLARMAVSRGVAMTAGFEAVAEAMLLGKPALMVPVPGHYEQHCNALDAERAGAGLAARAFDLDRLLTLIPRYVAPAGFRAWVAGAEAAVVGAIEEAAEVRRVT